jgi:hypothetical protein
MKNLIFILCFLKIFPLQAALSDLNQYDLTAEQRQLVERLIDRGLDESLIIKLIDNIIRQRQDDERRAAYIPPHTPHELDDLTRWTEGGAFNSFSRQAGVAFDGQVYMADCPNLPLFNYARATNSTHLGRDVMQLFNGRVHQLQVMLSRDPESFQDNYLRLIKGTRFEKYISW